MEDALLDKKIKIRSREQRKMKREHRKNKKGASMEICKGAVCIG